MVELRIADWGLPISDRNSLQKPANKSAHQTSIILVESSGAEYHGPCLLGGGVVRSPWRGHEAGRQQVSQADPTAIQRCYAETIYDVVM